MEPYSRLSSGSCFFHCASGFVGVAASVTACFLEEALGEGRAVSVALCLQLAAQPQCLVVFGEHLVNRTIWKNHPGREGELLTPDAHKAGPTCRMPAALTQPSSCSSGSWFRFQLACPGPFLSFFPPLGARFPTPAHRSFLLAFGNLCPPDPHPHSAGLASLSAPFLTSSGALSATQRPGLCASYVPQAPISCRMLEAAGCPILGN